MFDEISTAQWMWYYYSMKEDEQERFNTQRDFVEYHASFIEPEAVKKIRESRENKVEVPHEAFVAGIEKMFGRKIPIDRERKKGLETHEAVSQGIGSKVLDSLHTQQNKSNIKHWTDLDLDK